MPKACLNGSPEAVGLPHNTVNLHCALSVQYKTKAYLHC